MNLLWIVKSFPPDMGGVQRYSYNTILNLNYFKGVVLCGENISSKTYHDDEQLCRKGHKVIRSNFFPDDMGPISLIKKPIFFIRFFLQFVNIIRNEKIDLIIFGHFSFYYLYISLFLKLFINAPLTQLFHGEDIPLIHLKSNRLMKWMINIFDHCICNSNYTKNRLNNFLGKNVDCFIAFPGVCDNFFYEFNVPSLINLKPVIYTLARLDKRKGYDTVIKALPFIKNKFPTILYKIGGKGPERQEIEHLIKSLNLIDNVYFDGFVPDDKALDFHQQGDIFVMPNRTLADGDAEGFGIVFIEAGAAGKPVIGGRDGGALDSVVDGVTGYLVEPDNSHELADKIIYLLEHPEIAHKMGESGRKRAFNNFRWEFLVNKFEIELLRYLR